MGALSDSTCPLEFLGRHVGDPHHDWFLPLRQTGRRGGFALGSGLRLTLRRRRQVDRLYPTYGPWIGTSRATPRNGSGNSWSAASGARRRRSGDESSEAVTSPRLRAKRAKIPDFIGGPLETRTPDPLTNALALFLRGGFTSKKGLKHCNVLGAANHQRRPLMSLTDRNVQNRSGAIAGTPARVFDHHR
jgi:hypothetical protein